MATLLLTAGAASLGLSGFSLFAANLAATAIGTFIDNSLLGVTQNIQQEGPRLQEIAVTTSSEGQPIKRLFGRSRIGGNMIWTTNFREVKTTETEPRQGWWRWIYCHDYDLLLFRVMRIRFLRG